MQQCMSWSKSFIIILGPLLFIHYDNFEINYFQLCPDWQIDYESYNWVKLDAADSKTTDLVQQYFSWTGKDKDGREFNQGKIFK